MKVKVQCPCGSKFEFEVEPLDGRMPVAINCPACGNDATALANEVIQNQLAGASPAPPATPAPPVPPPMASLRISKTHAAAATATTPAAPAAESEEAPAGPPCPRHKTEPAVENCVVCGKPICLKCMEQFGYVCSVYCRQQAERRQIAVPVYALQKSVVAGKSNALAKRLTLAILVVIVAVLGFWFWYAWFARNPKIVYTVSFPKPDLNSDKYVAPPFYQLIGPGQFVTFKDKQLSLFDVAQQKQIWSVTLADEKKSAADQTASQSAMIKAAVRKIRAATRAERDAASDFADEDPFGFGNPKIVTTTNDIWVSFSDRLARFDRNTGATREVPIKGKIESVNGNEDAIIAVSENSDGSETLNKISLPDGEVQTETLKSAEVILATNKVPTAKGKSIKPNGSVDKIPIGGIKNLATQSSQPAAAPDDLASSDSDDNAQPFVIDGSSVVQMETKVLEHKTVSHVAMKAKGKSVLDSDNLNASQGLDVAQEMMNDSRREATGGVEIEDVSRYQVTLHRHFALDVKDWTGEVIGPPRFYALKTVDIICAGQTICVFDKTNKKLWDAKLTFSVASRFNGDPCLETADALYFSDLGMLTRYDVQTGNVRWRYNTVGVSKIQADSHGALYINTTTAGPESIQYSQQINIHDKIHPVIEKIDPATGKAVWTLRSVGDTCYISGKFLYSTLISTSMAALHLEDGPDRHYYLNLLDPRNGSEIWAIHRGNEHLIKTEVQKNWILVQFQEEMFVIKFFSL